MSDVVRLLRVYVVFRLLSLAAIWAVLRLSGGLPAGVAGAGLVAIASFLFVWLPGLPDRLGRDRFLAIALFLLITSQAVELTATGRVAPWQSLLGAASDEYWAALLAWRGESFFYLLVPVVVAGWVYGRRGTLWAATWAALTYLIGGAYVWMVDGVLPIGYLTTLPPKLFILYLVSYVVAHLATVQRRQQADLEAAHARLKRQATLAEQLATSRERNRLARELHDTLAHSLSGLSVQLQAADVLFDDDPAQARRALTTGLMTARSGLAEARRAIAALRASPLQDLGLVEAVRRRLETIGERAGVETDWQVEGDFGSLDFVTEQTIYRVAEEALLNAERHAAASCVTVHLSRINGSIHLTVRDDGHGFDAMQAGQVADGHYGLAGMEERAALAGGRLEVTSAAGGGTLVALAIEEAGV